MKMSENKINSIVIVGGGTAGWLTAAILASDRPKAAINITVIESPDIKPIGVGEGTWPSMRNTLQRIGVSETDFIKQCAVSFKQGTHFIDWVVGNNDSYYHPFSLPEGFPNINLAAQLANTTNFSNKVTAQTSICDANLAPKQATTPEFAYVVNYGYHLDSVKFSNFLQQHCVDNLQVEHIVANVTAIEETADGYIKQLNLDTDTVVVGDIFVDCTGFKSLLLGNHYKIPKIAPTNILFNDTALAVQIPYAEADTTIPSVTKSTAKTAGWIWDISLPTRKGIGYVYSSSHISHSSAEAELEAHIASIIGGAKDFDFRKLNLEPGYRQKLWHKNCLAIGISAGFVEPLEASALVLIELSAQMLSEQLPADRQTMAIVAKRFNNKFLAQWQRIIEFLKLHYVLSQRTDSDYWLDNKSPQSIPDNLKQQLLLWRHRTPWHCDLLHADDLFAPASFQYILYGMGFKTEQAIAQQSNIDNAAALGLQRNIETRSRQLLKALPTNRQLITAIMRN